MKLKDMLYVSMFAAVIAALGLIPPIPLPFLPVPITAQTFGVMLAGSVLGAKRGGLSLLIVVLLVAVGAPILSGGRGGFSIIVGPTGGFLLSWPIAALVIGLLVEKYWAQLKLWNMLVMNIIGGIIIINICGITFLSATSDLTWGAAALSSLVFIPGDLIKAILSSIIALQIKKSYPVIQKHHHIDAA